MNFAQAFQAVLDGKKITKKGKNWYVQLLNGNVCLRDDKNNTRHKWYPDHYDLIATDWEIKPDFTWENFVNDLMAIQCEDVQEDKMFNMMCRSRGFKFKPHIKFSGNRYVSYSDKTINICDLFIDAQVINFSDIPKTIYDEFLCGDLFIKCEDDAELDILSRKVSSEGIGTAISHHKNDKYFTIMNRELTSCTNTSFPVITLMSMVKERVTKWNL